MIARSSGVVSSGWTNCTSEPSSPARSSSVIGLAPDVCMVIGSPSARAPSQSRLICSIVRTPRDAAAAEPPMEGAEIARADAEREQIVFVGHPILLDARQAGEIHRRIVGHADRRAVGETSADAHVAHA